MQKIKITNAILLLKQANALKFGDIISCPFIEMHHRDNDTKQLGTQHRNRFIINDNIDLNDGTIQTISEEELYYLLNNNIDDEIPIDIINKCRNGGTSLSAYCLTGKSSRDVKELQTKDDLFISSKDADCEYEDALLELDYRYSILFLEDDYPEENRLKKLDENKMLRLEGQINSDKNKSLRKIIDGYKNRTIKDLRGLRLQKDNESISINKQHQTKESLAYSIQYLNINVREDTYDSLFGTFNYKDTTYKFRYNFSTENLIFGIGNDRVSIFFREQGREMPYCDFDFTNNDMSKIVKDFLKFLYNYQTSLSLKNIV